MALVLNQESPEPGTIKKPESVHALPSSALFTDGRAHEGHLPYEQRALLSLKRAQAVVKAHALTFHDVEFLTQPFWDCHISPALAMDSAAATLVTIQINLAAGTLVGHVHAHPSYRHVLKDVLNFDVIAHWSLTEVAHGLDAINIETIATALPGGGYELHTPHPGAAKIMPPTVPCGIPAIAIVFAKLVVDGKNHGTRPFLLPINDGRNMAPGITAKLLPPRGGSNPVLHSITSFNRVQLPPEALLGTRGTPAREQALARTEHLAAIWRTAVGALALASGGVSTMERAAYIAGRFSLRRTVGTPSGARVSVFTFRTQHAPILATLAWCFVTRAFWQVAIDAFRDRNADLRVRHAWATIFKVTALHHAESATLALAPRCGAQGLFNHNDIIELHSTLLGIQIAEGDSLAVCIRLASELLLNRYQIPVSHRPTSLLAQHEEGLLQESRDILQKVKNHRGEDFNRLVLPKCEAIVRAIGHRMAYDAALDAGLDAKIVELYVATVVKLDSAWYVEHGLSRASQDAREDAAIREAFPEIASWLEDTGLDEYVKVPITSQRAWDDFVRGLRTFGSSGEVVSTAAKL